MSSLYFNETNYPMSKCPDTLIFVEILKLTIQLIYILPITFLYFYSIFVILKDRKVRRNYSDSFFTIYLFDGVVSLVYLLIDIGFVRMIAFVQPICALLSPIFFHPNYYSTPIFFISTYCQFSKLLATVSMSIHRHTSVNYPFFHYVLWKIHIKKVVLVVFFLLPLLFSLPVGTTKTMVHRVIGQVYFLYVHRFKYIRTTYFRLLIGVPSLIFIIYSNTKTMKRLSRNNENMKKVERNLTNATLFISIGFVLFIFVQIANLILTNFISEKPKSEFLAEVYSMIQQFVNDFYIISSPIALLITDRRIRQSIWKVSDGGAKIQSIEVPMTTASRRSNN